MYMYMYIYVHVRALIYLPRFHHTVGPDKKPPSARTHTLTHTERKAGAHMKTIHNAFQA